MRRELLELDDRFDMLIECLKNKEASTQDWTGCLPRLFANEGGRVGLPLCSSSRHAQLNSSREREQFQSLKVKMGHLEDTLLKVVW